MGIYDDQISPRIVSALCGMKAARRQRLQVLPRARGRVLEIGLGSGHNLPLYDPARVDLVFGLEPSETMRGLARPKAKRAPFEVRFLDLPGEQVPLEDDSVDTVVTTFSLCTIPDVDTALGQMRRVLRPGGELLFLEHGESPDEPVRRFQTRAEPRWKKLFGGCHLTRRIPDLIESAGFSIQELRCGYLSTIDKPYVPAALKIPGYEYWGSARIR